MTHKSFLQTKEWLEFQKSLGREVFEYNHGGISAKIIKHGLPLGKSYLYIPHGPEMDPVRDLARACAPEGPMGQAISNGVDFNAMIGGFKDPVRNFVDYLRDLGQQEKSIFVKAEPLTGNVAQMLVDSPGGRGFRRSWREIQPSKTVVIEIQKMDADLLEAMHYKTRYNIKVAENRGVVVEESSDLEAFWKLMQETTARDKFSSHPRDYYFKLLNFFKPFKPLKLSNSETSNSGISVKLFLAKLAGKPAAAAVVLIYGNTGYYLHGASDYDLRSAMAPYLLHWQIIQWLKKEGIESYDLWGIDAKKWPGVTRFKLNWGGRVVDHPGSFDLTISKLWHILYEACRGVFRQ